MRFPTCAESGSAFRKTIAIATVPFILLTGAVGCSSPKSAPKTGLTVAGTNTNSHGLVKLSASEIEQKIQAVQSNKTIPDSAKPRIIESIRAQGEP